MRRLPLTQSSHALTCLPNLRQHTRRSGALTRSGYGIDTHTWYGPMACMYPHVAKKLWPRHSPAHSHRGKSHLFQGGLQGPCPRPQARDRLAVAVRSGDGFVPLTLRSTPRLLRPPHALTQRRRAAPLLRGRRPRRRTLVLQLPQPRFELALHPPRSQQRFRVRRGGAHCLEATPAGLRRRLWPLRKRQRRLPVLQANPTPCFARVQCGGKQTERSPRCTHHSTPPPSQRCHNTHKHIECSTVQLDGPRSKSS